MKKLPIGIQTFEKLINDDCLYVDKTKLIYQLIQSGSVYFLSRPRRFGKSLLLSTLDAIFKGKKELFQGLWIYDQPFEWKEYPVIRIDFSKTPSTTVLELKKSIIRQLDSNAEKYGVKLKEEEYYARFEELIVKLAKINKVVVLIDEYDKPILDNITEVEVAKEIQNTLKAFYTVIKASDEYLKFIFLTGVSKFSKVGVFSGLNNLEDLTTSMDYAAILGYTQQELEFYFVDYIETLMNTTKNDPESIRQLIKQWYNGYRFTIAEVYVYNPFSTLLLFKHRQFENYWFESGTPTFLIDLIMKMEFEIDSINELSAEAEVFSSYELDYLEVEPLLFQTGYITIKDYQPQNQYVLGYPNYEVAESFEKVLLKSYACVSKTYVGSSLQKLVKAIEKGNLADFFEIMRVFFANIPYSITLPKEKYYQTIFYLIFALLGLRIQAEVTTNRGRIDAVIELSETVYVFEFKLNGTKEQALEQIKKNDYAQKYQGTLKHVILIGVEFDKVTRNVGEWIISEP